MTTCYYTHPHTPSHTLTHPHTMLRTLTLPHPSVTHPHTTHIHPYTLTLHPHTHTHPHPHSHPHPHTLTLILTHPHTFTQPHTPTLTLSHILTTSYPGSTMWDILPYNITDCTQRRDPQSLGEKKKNTGEIRRVLSYNSVVSYTRVHILSCTSVIKHLRMWTWLLQAMTAYWKPIYCLKLWTGAPKPLIPLALQ